MWNILIVIYKITGRLIGKLQIAHSTSIKEFMRLPKKSDLMPHMKDRVWWYSTLPKNSFLNVQHIKLHSLGHHQYNISTQHNFCKECMFLKIPIDFI